MKARDAHETALRETVDRLSDGTLGCLIKIQMRNAVVTDAGDRKRIAAAVHAWIHSGPPLGSSRKFGPLLVELLSVGGDRVDVITVKPMHVIDKPSSIGENIDEKVRRYGGLGPALLVAAVKHHRAEIHGSDPPASKGLRVEEPPRNDHVS